MKKFAVFCLFFHSICFSQSSRKPVSAGYIQLGAYSVNHVDALSVAGNPAALSQIATPAIGIYSERRWMLVELSHYNLIIAVPTQDGNFGLQADRFGSAVYAETRLGLVYSRKLDSKIDVGAAFNFHSITMSEYGNASTISFDIGAVLHFTERLHAGLKASNPVGGKFNKTGDEKLSSVYTMGLGFEASERFYIGADIEKEETQPVQVSAGLQYKFLRQLQARAGMSTATSSLWLGLGVIMKSLRIDVTSNFHPQLGITPGLLLLFNMKSRQE